jgi:hypothetical protein
LISIPLKKIKKIPNKKKCGGGRGKEKPITYLKGIYLYPVYPDRMSQEKAGRYHGTIFRHLRFTLVTMSETVLYRSIPKSHPVSATRRFRTPPNSRILGGDGAEKKKKRREAEDKREKKVSGNSPDRGK